MATLLNEILRDYFRFTGDGKTDEPVGAPLPIGDPESGVHVPSKKDLREWGQSVENIATGGNVGIYEDALILQEESISVSVGTFGEYATINEALEFLSGYRMAFKEDGIQAGIVLRPGFVMSEQIAVKNGMDLGWVTITASDATVLVNPASITKTFPSVDGGNPVFYATGGARLPRIGCLFYYGSNTTAKDGVFCYNGHVEILPGCGIRQCRDGIRCYHGATVTCMIDGLRSSDGEATSQLGVDFRSCKGRALDVQYGGVAQLPRSRFQNCEAAIAVYVIWGNSFAGIYQSDISNSVGEAVLSRDTGRADCRQCDVSGSYRGFHTIHGGYINARSKTGDTTWARGGASNCTDYAVMCTNGSFIECPELNCDDCGGRAIHSDSGSLVNAQLATARRAGNVALNCSRGSTINADQIIATGSKTGIMCRDVGRVNANLSDFSGCTDKAVDVNDGSSVSVNNSNLNGCSGDYAIDSISSVVSAFEVQAKNCTGIAAIRSFEGGEVQAVGSDVSGATGSGMLAGRGGKIIAEEATATGAGVFGYNIGKGSTIVATGGATGTLSESANTLTASGVIFQ
jgi:hypothetical protein